MAIDKREKRELVLEMWSKNVSEGIIAKIMHLTPKQVHSYIYDEGVSMKADISNTEQFLNLELTYRILGAQTHDR